MKLSKKEARLRRATKFRAKHSERDVERLCVFKSSQHIYAQIISSCGTKTLASASSVSPKIKNGGNVEAASNVYSNLLSIFMLRLLVVVAQRR